MKTAKELFAEAAEKSYFYIVNYQPIIEEFGNIVVQVDDENYQGDSRILYHNASGRIGYLNFGWGSCSGCDALQACNTFEEVDELIQQLHDAVIWWNTKSEALEYFKYHDWKGDYHWEIENQERFVKEVIEYLEK